VSAQKLFRIGEFARLSHTPVKTLRFYDQLGLLEPAAVDARTRYRYYQAAQLQDLAAIRALQDLGASLADIREVLASPGMPRRRRLLSRLRSDALRTLAATQRSLEWIELELADAPQVAGPSVVFQARGEMRIASIRARLRSYDEVVPVESELARQVHRALAGAARGVLWHRCEASGAIEGEPFMEVRRHLPRNPAYEVRQLPAAQVASAYCACDDVAALRAYDTLERWIHRHALRLDGPKRELYVGNLLEIQFPVRPV
jgi:DNA-binding transcriptional MerR regulator